MTLKEYLEREGLKQKYFAKKTGLSNRTIIEVCKGYKLNVFMSKAIEVATNGSVKACDICRNLKELKRFESNID